jgi:hypothetical protein
MAGLFIALAIYVVFIELPRNQRELDPDEVPLLEGYSAREALKIDLAAPLNYTLEKSTNGEWVLTVPRRDGPYRVDQSSVWTLLDDLAGIYVLQSLKNLNPRLEQYGLEPPQGAMVIEAEGGKRWHLSFGLETGMRLQGDAEASSQSYVLVDGNPPVKIVETFKINRLQKPAAEYRYRHIFDIDLGSLQAVEINYKGNALAFIRENDAWFLSVRGERTPLDPQKMLSLLAEIFEFTVDDFISDAAYAAQYGIYPGSSFIKVTDAAGTRALSFGRIEEGKIYCALAPYGEIYSVLEDKFNRFDKKPADFLPDEPAADADAE